MRPWGILVQKRATRQAQCRAWRSLRKAHGAVSRSHRAEDPWASELPSGRNSETQRRERPTRASFCSSLSRSLLFLRCRSGLCRHSIHDGTVAAHQILGRESLNLCRRDFSQFIRDLVNSIKSAVEKHSVRERRRSIDGDLKLVVPVGSHLGDDSIQILLTWSFADKLGNSGVVSRQKLIF